MKIEEAREKGIAKLRLPKWNEWAYIDISGAWILLFDIGANGMPIPESELTEDTWEEWKEPSDYKERAPKIYEITT